MELVFKRRPLQGQWHRWNTASICATVSTFSPFDSCSLWWLFCCGENTLHCCKPECFDTSPLVQYCSSKKKSGTTLCCWYQLLCLTYEMQAYCGVFVPTYQENLRFFGQGLPFAPRGSTLFFILLCFTFFSTNPENCYDSQMVLRLRNWWNFGFT